MSINFDELLLNTKTVTADIGMTELIEVTFKTAFYTPIVSARIRSGEEDIMKVQIEVMVDAITSWNLITKEGTMVPITKETLNKLNLVQINAIYSAMEGSVFPPVTKAAS